MKLPFKHRIHQVAQRQSLVITMAKLTLKAQKNLILTPKNIEKIRLLLKRLQQSFRLMVGIPDYATYLQHMQEYHPDLTPMDEKTFFRYCIDTRYPNANTQMKRCPC